MLQGGSSRQDSLAENPMITVILFYFFLFTFWLENVFGFSLSPIKGLSLLNVSYYLLLFNWGASALRKRVLFEPNSVNKYLSILACVIVTSIPIKLGLREVDNISLMGELLNLKGWLNPILLFFILYNTLDKEHHCSLALLGLILFMGVVSISTIAAQAGLVHLPGTKVMAGRAAGFAEPNQLAACLVLFLPILASGVLFGDGKRKKLFSLILILLLLIALVITGSRGGIIALGCCILVYFWIFSRKRLLRFSSLLFTVFLAFPLLMVSVFVLTPETVRESVATRFDPSTAANASELTSGRTTLWVNGFQLFLQSPLYGHGMATFVPLMKKNFPIWANSHNDYLLYLVHHGIVGLGLFLLVLGSLFHQSWQITNRAEDRATSILALSYFSGLAGFAVAMFGVNIIQPLYLFWAYSAIVLKIDQLPLPPQVIHHAYR